MSKFISSRGQFFSPDLVIAVGVFVFGLVLFFNASNSIFAQTELYDSRKEADEVAHSVLDSLILSSGTPANWQNESLEDINSFGLVSSPNIIDSSKASKLVDLLNDSLTYYDLKEKLGFGPYDMYLSISKPSGSTTGAEIVSGGRTSSEPLIKLVYQRIVYYEGEEALMNLVISTED